MAKIFVDANIFIDLVEKRKKITSADLDGNKLFISPLSAHILMYVAKKGIPYRRLEETITHFGIVPLTKDILDKALEGPTKDLEDNIQLHSASEAECDLFLTEDKKLLNMKFFGKCKIISIEQFKL